MVVDILELREGVERERVGRAREKNNIRMLISSPSDRNTNPRCGDGR